MKTRGLLRGIFSLAALAAFCGCGSFGGSETAFREESKTLDSAKIDGVVVNTRSGHVQIVGTHEEKIEWRAVRRAQASSRPLAEKLLEGVRVTESREGSIWKLSAEFPPTSSLEEVSVHFELRVPSRMTASVETQNGETTLQGVEGKIAVNAHNGAVKVSGARAAVRVRSHNGETVVQGDPSSLELISHNGSIDVSLNALRALEKESSIECHNGRIALAVPAGFSAGLNASCGNGSLHVEAPGRWEKNASHEVRGALGTGGAKLRVDSHNGEVRIWERK